MKEKTSCSDLHLKNTNQMKRYLGIIFVLCFVQITYAQLADVTYSVQTVNVTSYENATGGSCWESGNEEYTAYVGAWDNINGTATSTGCQICDFNGNCTYAQNLNLHTRTNNAYSISSNIDAWEDDRGGRCSYDGPCFLCNSDDCRRQQTASYNFREQSFPSNGTYTNGPTWGSTADHQWTLRTTWRYSGTTNLITPTCTAQNTAYAAGGIRSWSVNLTAGVVYNFNNCSSAASDTYIRLYGPDGFTIVSAGDDNCGVLSSIQYTAAASGTYYVELSQFTRGPLTAGGTLTYSIVAPTVSTNGGNVTICQGTNSVGLNGSIPAVGAGTWAASSGNVSFSNINTPNATLTSNVSGNYIATWTISNGGCTSSSNLNVTVDAAPTLGTLSNPGPIDFCDAGGNFTTAVNVSGQVGSVMWDWGSNNGVWNNNWVAGANSGICCFPKKVSNSDGNADRIRYRVTNGSCSAVTSGTILIRNRYNEAPTNLASSSSVYCSNAAPATITLTANFPTSINMNGMVNFYSGSCGGTLVGSVSPVASSSSAALTIASPGTTTTYYARYEPGSGLGCSNSACVSTTVTVNTVSIAPVSITGTSTICAGGSTTLTLSGGTAGTGATAQWYSGSCGGTLVGTGNSVSVSPATTTTYFVRYSGTCNTTTCASVTVTVNTISTAPTITPVAGTICPNTNTTLTAGGGIAGTGSTINWYTGANGTGTFLGSGSSIVVAPTANTTYYARREGTCNTTADASVTLTVKNFVYALNGATSNTYCTDNSGWHHFYSGDEIIFSVQGDLTGAPVGYPLAIINDNGTFYQETEGPGTAPGCASNQNPGEERFEMERSWNLDMGGGAPIGTYNIRFYYQPAERTAIETAAVNWMATYPDCGYGYKYPNPLGFYWFKNSGSNYTAPDYDGTQYTATVASVSGVNYAEWTGITGFSGGSGAIILEPITTLPIELLSFTAVCEESSNEVTVRWSTASEQNSSHFTVERSLDGIVWEVLGTVHAAGNSTSNLNYELTDSDVRGQALVYYRLNQFDLDGAAKVYGPASAECLNDQLGFEMFPNPAGTDVTVLLHGEHQTGETEIVFTDLNGKEVKRIIYNEQTGKMMSVDLRNLEPGVYLVRLITGDTNDQFVRLIKQ